MNPIEVLERIDNILSNPDKKCLEMSMSDVHHKGVFSLVINGHKHGQLTRAFIANKKIDPFKIQLHTHRYPIRLTVIKGNVNHIIAKEKKNKKDFSLVCLAKFKYKSPLNGGSGLSYIGHQTFDIKNYLIPIGGTINMGTEDYHTISCSKGSIWVVEELGFKRKSSKVLGVPFVTQGLYNKPNQFEINDNFQLLNREVKELILDYSITK